MLTGASISVQGTIVASQGTKQKVELKVEKIIVVGPLLLLLLDLLELKVILSLTLILYQVGKCDSSYLIQKKRVSREFLRTKAHLRPRTNTFGAVMFLS